MRRAQRSGKINSIGYLFILPAAIFHIIFVLYPIVQTGILSLYKWDGASPVREFVGLRNYVRIFQDQIFWRAFLNNTIWIAWHIVIPVTTGLFLAILVSSITRGRTIFRAIFFMPAVLSLVVVGLIWSHIFNPRFGILNKLLETVGLDFLAHPWLGDPKTALLAIMIASSWIWTGYCFVVFLAGLQQINRTLYDAAKIDGATWWQSLWHVTIPGLKDVTTIVYVWTIMAGLKVFAIIAVMTAGGPHYATQTIANWMYEVSIGSAIFTGNRVGYGSAIAYCLGIIVIASSILFMRLREKER